MKQINLLDWREERRERLKKQFAQGAIAGVLEAVAAWAGWTSLVRGTTSWRVFRLREFETLLA